MRRILSACVVALLLALGLVATATPASAEVVYKVSGRGLTAWTRGHEQTPDGWWHYYELTVGKASGDRWSMYYSRFSYNPSTETYETVDGWATPDYVHYTGYLESLRATGVISLDDGTTIAIDETFTGIGPVVYTSRSSVEALPGEYRRIQRETGRSHPAEATGTVTGTDGGEIGTYTQFYIELQSGS